MRQGIFALRQACPQCRGAGKVIENPCKECRGSGKVEVEREIEVRIPAGVEDGMQMRLGGQGESGDNGAPAGDLFCVISIEEHPFFERHNQDLLCQVPITFAQAALGGEIAVPTVDQGKTTLTIPRGTQSGQVLRLRGLGMPALQGSGVGDLLVRAVVVTPTRLNAEQEALLRKYAETEEQNVSPERKSFFDRLKAYFEG